MNFGNSEKFLPRFISVHNVMLKFFNLCMYVGVLLSLSLRNEWLFCHHSHSNRQGIVLVPSPIIILTIETSIGYRICILTTSSVKLEFFFSVFAPEILIFSSLGVRKITRINYETETNERLDATCQQREKTFLVKWLVLEQRLGLLSILETPQILWSSVKEAV